MTPLRSLPALLLLPAVLHPLAAQAAPPSGADGADGVRGQTQVVANCSAYRQTPRRLVSACADLGSLAVVRDWTSWTGHQARGSGTWVVNSCTPDCAAGNIDRYAATFSLHRVVTVDGTRVFSRLGVTYVRDGEPHDVTVALPTTPVGD